MSNANVKRKSLNKAKLYERLAHIAHDKQLKLQRQKVVERREEHDRRVSGTT